MSAALRDATTAEHVFVRAGGGAVAQTHGRRAARACSALTSGGRGTPTTDAPREAGLPARDTGPRARLVRAVDAATPLRASRPHHAVPPTVGQRLDVLRAQDRSPVLDAADEERGVVPALDPGLVAGRIALATVEVLGGRRPIGQLARWLTPGVLAALQVRAALTLRVRGASTRAPQIRRVRTSAVDEHTLEAGVVVEDGAVVRAVALRLESHRGAWRTTALEIG